jgi:serine/threonine-protein kinase
LTPFATGRASDISPIWTHDGRSILFARGRAVAPAILRRAVAAGGPIERLSTITDSLLLPNSLAADGRHLVVTASVATGFDLQVVDLAGSGAPEPLVSTSVDELNGEVSPDGRWLAYQSRQSGQFEIWVQRFDRPLVDQPPAPSSQPLILSAAPRNIPIPVSGALPLSPEPWQVSNHGGTRPVWARDGRELFYLTVAGQLMAVPIPRGDNFQSGVPIQLFTSPIYDDPVGRTFDVSPDGRHFLAVVELRRTP